jgi:hypothetical protein
MSTSSSSRLRVTIVHGNWAHGFIRDSSPRDDKRWFKQGGDFFEELKKALNKEGMTPELMTFEWTGENSLRAREEAASRLARELQAQASANPQSWQFLVAHSHGGTAIISALQRLDQPIPNLGIVTLATPFLELTPYRVRWITKFGIFLLWYLFFDFSGYEANQKALATILGDAVASRIVMTLDFLLALVVTIRLTQNGDVLGILSERNARRRLEYPFLVLRATFDEASLGIWLGNTAEIILRFLRVASTVLAAGLTVAIPLFVVFLGALSLDAMVYVPGKVRGLWNDVGVLLFSWVMGNLILSSWKAKFVAKAAILMGGTLLRAVSGRELMRCVAGVRARVREMPPHATAVEKVRLSSPPGLLMHSLYRHPEAAPRIAKWIANIAK